MSDGGDSSVNPLRVHGTILFIVAALIVAAGILGLVEGIQASGGAGPEAAAPTSAADAQKGIYEAQKVQREADYARRDVDNLGKVPRDLNDVRYAIGSFGRLKALLGRALPFLQNFAVPILIILAGGLVGVAALFIHRRQGWARIASFGGIAVAMVYAAVAQASALSRAVPVPGEGGQPVMALVEFEAWRVLVLIAIAGLAGKLLWDLAVERFAPAPATAVA